MRLAFCSLIMLAGCATASPPRIETRIVNVPIATPCIMAADVPVRPAKLARPLPTDADALLSLALAKLLRWQGYGDRADALINACVAK